MDKIERYALAEAQIKIIRSIETKIAVLSNALGGSGDEFMDDERWSLKENVLMTLLYDVNDVTMDYLRYHIDGSIDFAELLAKLEEWGVVYE